MQLTLRVLLTKREQIPVWLAQNDLKVLAELGVYDGSHLRSLLSSNPREMVAVDSWAGGHTDNDQAAADARYRQMIELSAQVPCLRVIRSETSDAAQQFDDGHFDFVYFDADHFYDGLTKDLEAWWPKVRPGGWLAGHDYDLVARGEVCAGIVWGVVQAVHEFIGRTGLPRNSLYHTAAHEVEPSWFLQKPE